MKRFKLTLAIVPLLAFGFFVQPAPAQTVQMYRSSDAIKAPIRDSNTAPAAFHANPELINRAQRMLSDVRAKQFKHSKQFHRNGLQRVAFDNPSDSRGFANRAAFTVQEGQLTNVADVGVFPVPLGRQMRQDDPHYRHNAANMQRSDEYVYDGSDREKRVQVDGDWNIYGMDSEDTFGHFDTLDGKRLVSPSNRVAIYAPRFSAVRRVDNLHKSERIALVSQFKKKDGSVLSRSSDFSSTTKQNVALGSNERSQKAFGFSDRTRGVVSDNVLQLRKAKDSFRPYENLDLMRLGRYSKSQSARLQAGLLAAKSWADNLGLQVHADKVQPVVVNDALTLQQMVVVETDDDNAILRVVKVASKVAARPGEEVEFTIRFDNLSPRKIGNVTLVDNLTTRLRYIPDSAECSLKGDFIKRDNDSGSLMLRWEITEPLPAGKGGVIRFKCLVK
jgi:uncharacterized repeat protein (TIGR01451 family)